MKTKLRLMHLGLLTAALLAGYAPAQNFSAWPVTKIAAGGFHSLFIKSDGTMWGMGDNSSGQLGLGASVTNVNVPDLLTNSVGLIAAGDNHSLFVSGSGRSLWAMGANSNGQLGDGTTANHYVPEKIFTVTGSAFVNTIAAGVAHSLFGTRSITGSGGLYAMGENAWGQLGNGSDTDQHAPVEILTYSAGNPFVTATAGGNGHSLFIKSDGSLWAMGDNSSGQLGEGSLSRTNKPQEIESSNILWLLLRELISVSLSDHLIRLRFSIPILFFWLWAMVNTGS
jgi:alpha-tubulin suppressor-like RCC1 family protein